MQTKSEVVDDIIWNLEVIHAFEIKYLPVIGLIKISIGGEEQIS